MSGRLSLPHGATDGEIMAFVLLHLQSLLGPPAHGAATLARVHRTTPQRPPQDHDCEEEERAPDAASSPDRHGIVAAGGECSRFMLH